MQSFQQQQHSRQAYVHSLVSVWQHYAIRKTLFHLLGYHRGFLQTMRTLRQIDIISLVNLHTTEAFESIGLFRYQNIVIVFVRINVLFSSLNV